MRRRYETTLPVSSWFCLTVPDDLLEYFLRTLILSSEDGPIWFVHISRFNLPRELSYNQPQLESMFFWRVVWRVIQDYRYKSLKLIS